MAAATLDDVVARLDQLQQEMEQAKGGVQLVSSKELVIPAVAQDYPIPTPPGTRSVQVRFVLTGTPNNNVQGYVSTGTPWQNAPNKGLAYDVSQGSYTGAALRPEEVMTFDMGKYGGMVHVATKVINTPVVINFFGSEENA